MGDFGPFGVIIARPIIMFLHRLSLHVQQINEMGTLSDYFSLFLA